MKKSLAILLSFLMAVSFIGCQKTEQTSVSDVPTVNINEVQPLVVGIENATESVNALFASAGSRTVADSMNSRLITTAADGTLSFGDGTGTLAKDLQIVFTNELGETHDEYALGDSVTYNFILKNGMKFSDNTPITADDVMFTLYTMLDPLYDGAYKLSSLKVDGLERYLLQMTPEIKEEYTALAEKFLENGKDGEYDEVEKPLADAFYTDIITKAGEEYCRVAVQYVVENYLTDEYVARYLSEQLTAAQVSQSETLKIAYAMIVWEVGAFNEEGKFALSSKTLDLQNGETLTCSDFWNELYSKKKDISKIDEDAVGENTVSLIATKMFVEKYGPEAMSEKIDSISGIQKGETLIDNTPFETVSVTLEGYDPSYVYSFTVPIVSRECYTNGYTYPKDSKISFGVPLCEESFISHLKNLTTPTVSSGAYKTSVGPLGEFLEENVYYLNRNDNYSTISGENALIKNLCFVNGDAQKLDDISAGEYMLAHFSLDEDSSKNLSKSENLDFFKLPINAYGYILINPRYYPDINERVALAMLFDPSLAVKYYPENTASVLNRSHSMSSYAYPTAKTLYPYNESDYTVREYFTKAGYTFEENKMLTSTGEVASFTFTLPTTADKHPCGAVFEKAVSRLVNLGAQAEIVVSQTLTTDIYSAEGVGIYALGRNLTNDADMRLMFDYSSLSDTVKANGVSWLWENGGSDDIGTVEINDTQYTQEKALEHLSDLLNTGAKLTDYSRRAEYYREALNTLEKLCIEVPMYQKNTVIVYDKTVLDLSLVSQEFSSFYTPLNELHKIKFK